MHKNIVFRSVLYGIIAVSGILGIYFSILTFVSGWEFTLVQFSDFWYFIVTLALGFGVQVSLFVYLRDIAHKMSSGVIAASGSTSTVAMISCCTHYLVNVLPVLGVTGVATFVGQYQVELFWVGIISNLAGIGYIANKILNFKKHQEQCLAEEA